MTPSAFDDSLLDDPVALERSDGLLRELALTGARVRLEAAGASRLTLPATPRGVVVVGAESRLVRAVIESVCPVPLLAWAFAGLPGWAGPLDLVVVQASGGDGADLLGTVAEAVRRGCYLLVSAPADAPVALASAARGTLLTPTRTGDPLAAAVGVLQILHGAGLGPEVIPEAVAQAADLVAEECTPHKDLSHNPAKDDAMALADAEPLLWGGSVLAARAARRVAEALRHGSGRPVLAAPAEELLPVLRAAPLSDLFDDPVDSPVGPRPVVWAFDDGDEATAATDLARLTEAAAARGVRLRSLLCPDPQAGPVDRYVSLLMRGRFAAAYLGVGLGVPGEATPGLWVPGR